MTLKQATAIINLHMIDQTNSLYDAWDIVNSALEDIKNLRYCDKCGNDFNFVCPKCDEPDSWVFR